MKDWSQMVKVPCPLALGTLLKKNLSPVKADEVPVWAHAFLGNILPLCTLIVSVCLCVCSASAETVRWDHRKVLCTWQLLDLAVKER